MTERTQTFAIVGSGLAGASAAIALRKEGFDGRIVLFGDEAALPYELPPLSKGYLRGEEDASKLLVRDAAFYAENGIELRIGTRVTRVDIGARTVSADGHEDLVHDRLLIATGSEPRRLPLPGATLANVFQLRTAADADAIRTAAATARRAVVVGSGWIGSEVAASLRTLGLSVVMVGQTSVPLEAVLGPEVGSVYRDLHLERGVELRMNELVTGFVGDRRVEGVRTVGGGVIDADLVVVGVGATPRLDLARKAGLEIDGGIVVDEYLEAAPGVFAAGDVAAAWHPALGERIRVEHWDNAKRQGAAAARNMLGRRVPYDRMPYFYSDQYDLGMEYVGYARGWDEVVFRGDPATRKFIAFWLRAGVPVAAMNANIWDVNGDLRAVVAARRAVAPDRLRDPSIPLAELVATAALAG